MTYTKTEWVNGETPINESNLNNIENGIVALQPSVISASCSEGNIVKTITTAWAQEKINITVLNNKIGDGFELDSTNGCIVVKSGVTKALINMNFMVSGSEGYIEMGFKIKRDDEYLTNNLVAAYANPKTNTSFASVSISPILLDLQENDQIEVYLSRSGTGELTIAGKKYTYITIQKV